MVAPPGSIDQAARDVARGFVVLRVGGLPMATASGCAPRRDGDRPKEWALVRQDHPRQLRKPRHWASLKTSLPPMQSSAASSFLGATAPWSMRLQQHIRLKGHYLRPPSFACASVICFLAFVDLCDVLRTIRWALFSSPPFRPGQSAPWIPCFVWIASARIRPCDRHDHASPPDRPADEHRCRVPSWQPARWKFSTRSAGRVRSFGGFARQGRPMELGRTWRSSKQDIRCDLISIPVRPSPSLQVLRHRDVTWPAHGQPRRI
ncbi:hypothetical protein GQ53DRAFT_240891 [Thozetella sp. PMI_491]|nr:hypothetical protein GQ53DRAFT_240891 [Thozetella sp. PMI_491]